MQVNHYRRQPLALFFLTVLLFSGVAPARPVKTLQNQPDAERKLPPQNWIRSRNIDVKHIAIDLRFDWQKKQAYGTTAVTFAPIQPDRTSHARCRNADDQFDHAQPMARR